MELSNNIFIILYFFDNVCLGNDVVLVDHIISSMVCNEICDKVIIYVYKNKLL